MAISPTYASPGLRLGLLYEDHPDAQVSYGVTSGAELGVPSSHGGGDEFVYAHIRFPSSGKDDAVGYKALTTNTRGNVEHESDVYNILCTKALGRALKRAGYADDTNDLKAVITWRTKNAEIRASLARVSVDEVASAITGAATTGSDDDTVATGDDAGGDVAASGEESVEQGKRQSQPKVKHDDQANPADSYDLKAVQADINSMSAGDKKLFATFCKQYGIDPSVAAKNLDSLSGDDIVKIVGWLGMEEDK